MNVRVLESADRRVLGAIRFVDATTALPASGEVVLEGGAVSLRRQRRGLYVLTGAPGFEEYVRRFEDVVATAVARFELVVAGAGPGYLPQRFTVALPRSLDPEDADSVFVPIPVRLFPSPSAAANAGWATVRATVTEAGSGRPVPGALINVYESPAGAGAKPLGQGMTDWRGRARGEALVPVPGLKRFAPGNGNGAAALVTEREIVLEVVRDPQFTGEPGTAPDAGALVEAAGAGLVRIPHAQLAIDPAGALKLRPGRELIVRLRLP